MSCMIKSGIRPLVNWAISLFDLPQEFEWVCITLSPQNKKKLTLVHTENEKVSGVWSYQFACEFKRDKYFSDENSVFESDSKNSILTPDRPMVNGEKRKNSF